MVTSRSAVSHNQHWSKCCKLSMIFTTPGGLASITYNKVDFTINACSPPTLNTLGNFNFGLLTFVISNPFMLRNKTIGLTGSTPISSQASPESAQLMHRVCCVAITIQAYIRTSRQLEIDLKLSAMAQVYLCMKTAYRWGWVVR